jgi:hypothetical protein
MWNGEQVESGRAALSFGFLLPSSPLPAAATAVLGSVVTEDRVVRPPVLRAGPDRDRKRAGGARGAMGDARAAARAERERSIEEREEK